MSRDHACRVPAKKTPGPTGPTGALVASNPNEFSAQLVVKEYVA